MTIDNLPKISIITPSYNQANCIEECILSVIEQDYSNIEFIIIDGKSTDNSVEIIKKYQDKITYWVSETDKGIYDAMNKGIKKATGDWIFFLGTDDKLIPNVLNRIFREVSEYREYHFIYGQVKLFPSGILQGKQYTKEELAHNTICHQSIFTHKNVFKKIGNFDIKYKISADYVFIMKIFSKSNIKKIYLPFCIAEYNELGASYYQSDTNFYKHRYKLTKKYLKIECNEYKYKANYKIMGQEGFVLINNREYKKGLSKIFEAMIHTKKVIFYIKNTLYWIKKSLN